MEFCEWIARVAFKLYDKCATDARDPDEDDYLDNEGAAVGDGGGGGGNNRVSEWGSDGVRGRLERV